MVATGWLSMGAEDIYLMGLFNMGRDSSGAGHYSFGWLGGEPDSSVRGGYTTTNQLDDNLHVGIGDGLEWVALDVIDGLENLVVGVVYDDGGQDTREQHTTHTTTNQLDHNLHVGGASGWGRNFRPWLA